MPAFGRRFWLLLLLGIIAASQAVPGRALDANDARPGSFAELLDLDGACRLKPWRTLQASGYDRGDGFYDSGNFLREEPERRYVLMEHTGPGCLDRMWFTRKSVREPYDLLIYLDDAVQPTIRMGLDELAGGTRAPFTAPFAGKVDLARWCYVPIGFRTGCRVELQPTAAPEVYQYRENSAKKRIPHVYYQITYRALPAGSAVHPFSWALDPSEARARDRAAQLWNRPVEDPWKTGMRSRGRENEPEGIDVRKMYEIPPAAAADVFTRTGPGTIRGFSLRPAPGTPIQKLALEMTWDGQPEPAVKAPVGTFFAGLDPLVPVDGLWLGSRDGTYYCRLPMPFRRSARISLRSTADQPVKVEVRVLCDAAPPHAEDAFFHAAAYDYSPPLPASDYEVLNVQGRGHWVGLVMDRPGNMEGDDRFHVDGERQPSLHGTGTEDFFSFAWGFAYLASLPLHGITRHSGSPVLYRIHLPAGVPFQRSLRLQFEHGHGNSHQGRYSGVAHFYLLPSAR